MLARCPNCGSYTTTRRRAPPVSPKGGRPIRISVLLILLAITVLFLGACIGIGAGVMAHPPLDANYSGGAALALLVALCLVAILMRTLRQPERVLVKCSQCGYEGPA
jgi:hypothetical protein